MTGSVSDFADVLLQTVTLAALSSTSGYGKPSFAAGTEYKARVVYKTQSIKNADGQDVMAHGVVWMKGSPVVAPEDQITLPDGSTPVILSLDRYADETGGYHHTRVVFG